MNSSVTPSVSNISFSGTLKVFLNPLVPVMPGFGKKKILIYKIKVRLN